MTKKPLDLFWFIPVSGDCTQLGSDRGIRYADFAGFLTLASNLNSGDFL